MGGIENLAEQQATLVKSAFGRKDYVRAVVFGVEALISQCAEKMGLNPHDYQDRLLCANKDGQYSGELKRVARNLKELRNSIAHGTKPSNKRLVELINPPQRLDDELKNILEKLKTSIVG